MTSPLDDLAHAYGILPDFHDLGGNLRPTSPETKLALLRGNGLSLDNDAMINEALAAFHARADARRYPTEIIVPAGEHYHVHTTHGQAWTLQTETSSDLALNGETSETLNLPPLPPGIHTLTIDGQDITLIAAPHSAPSIENVTGQSRIWGVNMALYGLNSARNSGLGDFADLSAVAAQLGELGADFLGINPVHSLGWTAHNVISPYSPSHRAFLSTRHIAVDQIGGNAGTHSDSSAIDYAAHGVQHRQQLETLFRAFTGNADFDTFCTQRGKQLARFALFEALSEQHGEDWRNWPANLQSPTNPDIAKAKHTLADRIKFHMWLQWTADSQLSTAQATARNAGMAAGLYLDFAVGARRGGAETWCEGNAIAQGVSLGAPPDHLGPEGQNWDLATYAPLGQSNSKYSALRHVLGETLRHAGIVRIDHVLGMNRSYWIPDDGSPGGYITQPFQSLLAVIAIEAHRARTVIVGEDLGLVPDGFRETCADHGLYGYSVLQYEKDHNNQFRHPSHVRANSLYCFGTHDTPTMKGYQQGRDIDWWKNLNWIDEDTKNRIHHERHHDTHALATLDGGDVGEVSFEQLSTSVHRSMGNSPAAMVSVQLDDMLGQVEAQNLPGTVDQHPNWRRRCDVQVEELKNNASLTQTAEIMRQSKRGTE